jgi:hypothetical protein
MAKRGPIDDAKQHFAAAVASGWARPFVRSFPFAAMLYFREPAGQIEATCIANDMRNMRPLANEGRRACGTNRCAMVSRTSIFPVAWSTKQSPRLNVCSG